MKRPVVASAPGKIILTGEHAVVYNEPALAMAIDKRVRASVYVSRSRTVEIVSKMLKVEARYELGQRQASPTGTAKLLYPCFVAANATLEAAGSKKGLRIVLESVIPVGAGLGSSAATAVAIVGGTAKALRCNLSLSEMSSIALEAEKMVHGDPSGIDNTVATNGGIIMFRKSEGFTRLRYPARLQLVVGCSKRTRPTREQVAKVASFVHSHTQPAKMITRAIGRLTLKASDALTNGDLGSLGELLTTNHWLVNSLGIAHPAMDKLVYTALSAGAYGAKLTGAGGGGCTIALVDDTSRTRVEQALKEAHALTFIAQVSPRGIMFEA